MPLGLLARVLLWSAGELEETPATHREVEKALALLKAKLGAVEQQWLAADALRRAKEGPTDGDSAKDVEQEELPWRED